MNKIDKRAELVNYIRNNCTLSLHESYDADGGFTMEHMATKNIRIMFCVEADIEESSYHIILRQDNDKKIGQCLTYTNRLSMDNVSHVIEQLRKLLNDKEHRKNVLKLLGGDKVRIDLPQCNLKTCRHFGDHNCHADAITYDRCDYNRLHEDEIAGTLKAQKAGKYEVYCDEYGHYRAWLKASNGRLLCTTEAYSSLNSCLNCVGSIKKIAADAEIVEL